MPYHARVEAVLPLQALSGQGQLGQKAVEHPGTA